ncbi:uncharacterized protein LOC142645105 [Dermatophagoides pteronyssinus]|uniref:uncharacterized protein LOC142645105 n=1 Tax=Dermatophagoides pteronyssinus TaxID=6956 RepID=UPI003F6816C8
MPFITNNTDNNNSIKSSGSCQKMFPQGSYRSYKSFLNHYSKEQPSQIRRVSNGSVPMTMEQSTPSSTTKSISSRSVKSKIAQFDQPQQQQQQRSYSIPNDNKSNMTMMMKRNNNNNDQRIMKNDLNLEKLLTLSSYEIELLDKDVLERFVQLLVSGQKLPPSTTETSGNGIDLNNNDNNNNKDDDDDDSKILTKNKLETDDDDIDQCKMNLIQSLKKQLENYRQTKQIGF